MNAGTRVITTLSFAGHKTYLFNSGLPLKCKFSSLPLLLSDSTFYFITTTPHLQKALSLLRKKNKT